MGWGWVGHEPSCAHWKQLFNAALFQLEKPLPLDQQSIAAVRLQGADNLPPGTPCVASGWGRTGDDPRGQVHCVYATMESVCNVLDKIGTVDHKE